MKPPSYTVRVHKSNLPNALKFCRENYGEEWGAISNRDGLWCCFWAGSGSAEHYAFHFDTELMAVKVVIQWST